MKCLINEFCRMQRERRKRETDIRVCMYVCIHALSVVVNSNKMIRGNYFKMSSLNCNQPCEVLMGENSRHRAQSGNDLR